MGIHPRENQFLLGCSFYFWVVYDIAIKQIRNEFGSPGNHEKGWKFLKNPPGKESGFLASIITRDLFFCTDSAKLKRIEPLHAIFN